MNWYIFAKSPIKEALDFFGLPENFSLSDLKKRRKELIEYWHPEYNKSQKVKDAINEIENFYQYLANYAVLGQRMSPNFPLREQSSRNKVFEDNVMSYIHAILKNNGRPINKQPEFYFKDSANSWITLPSFNRYINRVFNAFERTVFGESIAHLKPEFISIVEDKYMSGETLHEINLFMYDFFQERM